MTHFDVFNGDADGLCALHQLRLEKPVENVLVTGVKRDIALLERVDAQPGDTVTVLDISLDTNRGALMRLLDRGVTVRYFDHHRAAPIPEHPALDAHIDTAADICTSALVDRHLAGAQRIWAIVGAYGDSLSGLATRLSIGFAFEASQAESLRTLGEALNYNAYGESVSDLYFAPSDLYHRLAIYRDPFRFIAGEPVMRTLIDGMREDLAQAYALSESETTLAGSIVRLPAARWARRVHGLFANRLIETAPESALAVLIAQEDGGYAVSVRAPRGGPQRAGELCSEFPTGGGRRAAGGINHLPADALDQFRVRFDVLLTRGS